MSLFMSLDCPHCLISRSSFRVAHIEIISSDEGIKAPATYVFHACGACGHCDHLSIAEMKMKCIRRPSTSVLVGDLILSCRVVDDSAPSRRFESVLIRQFPKPVAPEAPDHLPSPVLRAFLDAEKAFSQGIWNLAAAGYRKAVDRAITPLIGEDAKGKMLGPKIGMLERTKLLPPAMLEWIRLVKDDGNFALHDDDQDFDTREEVEPARELAFTLLTYLYTLPEKVRIARSMTDKEGSTV